MPALLLAGLRVALLAPSRVLGIRSLNTVLAIPPVHHRTGVRSVRIEEPEWAVEPGRMNRVHLGFVVGPERAFGSMSGAQGKAPPAP